MCALVVVDNSSRASARLGCRARLLGALDFCLEVRQVKGAVVGAVWVVLKKERMRSSPWCTEVRGGMRVRGWWAKVGRWAGFYSLGGRNFCPK